MRFPRLLYSLLASYWGLLSAWAILALCFVLVPPWTHLHPLNDSFAYIQTSQHLAETGTLTLPPEMTTSFVAQAVWGALAIAVFGNSLLTLTGTTVFFAFMAVWGAYILVRVCGGPKIAASVAAASLAVNPLFFNLSYGFMTDIPFLALLLWSSICLIAGITRLDPADRRWLSNVLLLLFIGSLLASVAYLVRQLGFVPPVCALSVLWLRRQLTWRAAGALLCVPVITYFGYSFWHAGNVTWADSELGIGALPHFLSNLPQLGVSIVFRGLGMLQYLALFSLPLLLPRFIVWLRMWPRLKRPPIPRFTWFLLVVSHGGVLIFLANGFPVPSVLSVITREFTFGPDLLGVIPEAIGTSPFVRIILAVIATGAAYWLGLQLTGETIALGRDVLGRLRRKKPSSEVDAVKSYLVLTAGTLFGASIVFTTCFDRYILSFMPMVFTLVILHFARQPYNLRFFGNLSSWLAIVGFAALSMLMMANYRSWNDALWTGAQDFLDQNVPAEQIEATFDWNSWYLSDTWGHIAQDQHLPFTPLPWKYAWKANADHPLYTIAWSVLPCFSIVGTEHFSLPLGGTSQLYIMKYVQTCQ